MVDMLLERKSRETEVSEVSQEVSDISEVKERGVIAFRTSR